MFGACLANTFLNSIQDFIFQKIINPLSIDDYRDIPVLVGLYWEFACRILHDNAYEIKSVELTHNHTRIPKSFW